MHKSDEVSNGNLPESSTKVESLKIVD